MSLYAALFLHLYRIKPAMATDKDKNKDKNKSKDKDNAKDKGRYTCDPDPGNVNDSGSVYQPQGPPTFEKVWLMFQASDKKWQETERFLKEKSLETERLMKEQSRETDKRFKETERLVRNLSQNIGGLNNTVGEVAEEYFLRALEKFAEVAGVKIQRVGKLYGQTKELQREYDVVLFGQNALIAVEVKHKLEEKDVITYCEKSLPALKQLFPEYAAYKVIGGVAGMTARKGAVKLAIEKGLLVFTQSGQKVVQLNPEGFKPREF